MSSGWLRIAKGLGAGTYSQLVVIALQLATVPIFLSRWSLQEYGAWLLLSTVPTYLALTDLGVLSSNSSRMTVLVARGAPVGANRVFHASVFFVLFASAGITLLSPLLGVGVYLLSSSITLAVSAALLALGVVMAQTGGLASAVFRATNRNHTGIYWSSNSRLLEWVGGMLGFLAFTSPVSVASGMLIFRTLATLFSLRVAIAGQSVFTLKSGRYSVLRLHLSQSTANFLTTSASALSLQGFSLVVGLWFGPALVAVFGTYRTLSRTLVQATSILSHAAWPEYSRLYGRRQWVPLRRLFWRTWLFGALLSAIACVGLVLFLPGILDIWTHGKISFDPSLAWAFATYALMASSWHVPRVFLTAVGANRILAFVALSLSVLAVLAAFFSSWVGAGMVSIVLIMVVCEACCSAVAIILSLRRVRQA